MSKKSRDWSVVFGRLVGFILYVKWDKDHVETFPLQTRRQLQEKVADYEGFGEDGPTLGVCMKFLTNGGEMVIVDGADPKYDGDNGDSAFWIRCSQCHEPVWFIGEPAPGFDGSNYVCNKCFTKSAH